MDAMTKPETDARVPEWAVFLLKGVVVVAALFGLGLWLPMAPAWVVAVVWAAVCGVLAVGLAYPWVVRKVHKQMSLRAGGGLARLNEGRAVCLIVSFVLATILVTGLLLEVPKWSAAEWAIALAAVPAGLGMQLVAQRFAAREYEPMFAPSRAVRWSGILLGVLLCAAFLVVWALEPAPTYASATEAFLGSPNPFEGSPVTLLDQAGFLLALTDGMTSYGLAKAAEASFAGYLIIRLVLGGSALFGLASLIAMGALRLQDLKRVIQPLEATKRMSERPLVKRYVALAACLPVVLAVAFLIGNQAVADKVESGELTAAEAFVRDHVGVAAYLIDGKYYDIAAVENVVADARERAAALAADAEAELTPLINRVFDERLANVDTYLDWYYSLPADYERLAQFFAGTIEEGMTAQLEAHINEGVDDAQLTEKLDGYLAQAAELQDTLMAELAKHELVGVPEWLIQTKEVLAPDFLAKPLEPSQKLLDANARLGISAATGLVGGFVVRNLVTKAFFSRMTTTLVDAAATAGVAEAVGTTAGTVLAPGVGTAIGVVGGIAVGVLSDFLFLKADEALNREAYKAEIVDAIEESRAQLLAVVQSL